MKIKQWFCNHIWKLEKEETLYFTKRYILGFLLDTTETKADHYKCIKCDKTKIEENKRLVSV